MCLLVVDGGSQAWKLSNNSAIPLLIWAGLRKCDWHDILKCLDYLLGFITQDHGWGEVNRRSSSVECWKLSLYKFDRICFPVPWHPISNPWSKLLLNLFTFINSWGWSSAYKRINCETDISWKGNHIHPFIHPPTHQHHPTNQPTNQPK